MLSPPLHGTALAALVLGITLALTSPGLADRPPPTPGADARRLAEASFQQFASEWVATLHGRIARERDKPKLRAGAIAPLATFREIDLDYTTELRTTGRPQAPYVGVVHYTELTFTCTNLTTQDCPLAMKTPVSEVFRYRAGRWVY